MAKARRTKLAKPDARGNFRQYVGPVKFTLGNARNTSQGEAQRRLDAIRDLWDRQCNHPQVEIDYWRPEVLPYALALARGQTLHTLAISDHAKEHPGQAAEELEVLEMLRSLGLQVVADDDKALATGTVQLKRWMDQAIKEKVEEVRQEFFAVTPQLEQRIAINAPDSDSWETKTLHEAIADFREYKKRTGKRQDNGKLAPSPQNYVNWSKQLENHHEDVPLSQIKHSKIEEMLCYWKNRPLNPETKERCSYQYAKHLGDCLWAVLNYVDRSEDYNWTLPRSANDIKRTPIKLEIDRKKNQTRRVSKNTYTPEQLATIADELEPLGKLILALAVNCGGQPSEIGRIEVADVYQVHPETGLEGPFVIFDRPKTGEYGEWVLWPEVAQLVTWGIARAQRLGVERLICGENGEPWYREDWANRAVRFGKWWGAVPGKTERHKGVITKIIEKQPEFPRHSIKYLRKILPQAVRPKWGREIADLANARHVDAAGRQCKRHNYR